MKNNFDIIKQATLIINNYSHNNINNSHDRPYIDWCISLMLIFGAIFIVLSISNFILWAF